MKGNLFQLIEDAIIAVDTLIKIFYKYLKLSSQTMDTSNWEFLDKEEDTLCFV